jgi:hypothetical protein
VQYHVAVKRIVIKTPISEEAMVIANMNDATGASMMMLHHAGIFRRLQ